MMSARAPEQALPEYASELDALHRAHAEELRSIIASLPIRPGDRVLDLACGDGTFAVWLSERTGPSGEVVGVDVSPAFVDVAASRAVDAAGPVRFLVADVRDDFAPPEPFDHVFCAFSLYSLPSPRGAVEKMAQLVRPGGAAIVLENDHLHHVLLPWPPDLELAVRQAELEALEELGADEGDKWFIGRRLTGVLNEAGLEDVRVDSQTVVRTAPLGPAERTYLERWAEGVRRRADPFLSADRREELRRWLDPASSASIFGLDDVQVGFIDLIAVGWSPARASRS